MQVNTQFNSSLIVINELFIKVTEILRTNPTI
jgi:hypothetical protein